MEEGNSRLQPVRRDGFLSFWHGELAKQSEFVETKNRKHSVRVRSAIWL